MEHRRKGVLKINIDYNPNTKVRVGADGALNGVAGLYNSLRTTKHGKSKLTSFYNASSYFGFVSVEKLFGDEASPDFANANRAWDDS